MSNPFNVEEVVRVLRKHTDSYGIPKGMRLQTLANKLDVCFDKKEKWEIVRQLREHPNIEESERAPLRYVPTSELKQREEAAREAEEAKRRMEEAAKVNGEALMAFVEGCEAMRPSYESIPLRPTKCLVTYEERLRLEIRVVGTKIQMDVSYEYGRDERETLERAKTFMLPNVEAIFPTLEAFDQLVQTMQTLNVKMS